MKTKIIKIVTIAFIAVTVISSCTKYPDGPKFSLLTKKARITNNWKIEAVSFNGSDITSSYKFIVGDNYVLSITKDGKYSSTGNVSDDGTWKFGEDKDDAYFTSSKAGSSEQAYRILRLESKSMWFKHTESNGDVTIIKYKE